MSTIANYARPQLTIAQNREALAGTTNPVMYAVVLAPRYTLARYKAGSKPPGQVFDAAGQTLLYRKYDENGVAGTLGSTYKVDTATVKLFAEKFEARLASIASGTQPFYMESLDEPNVLRVDAVAGSVRLAGSGGTLPTAFRGRNAEVGDIVVINAGSAGKFKRTITGFLGKNVAATIGNVVDSPYNPATDVTAAAVSDITYPTGYGTGDLTIASGTFTGTTRGSKYLGTYGERYTLTISVAGAPGTAAFTGLRSDGTSTGAIATVDATGDYNFVIDGVTYKLESSSEPDLVEGEQLIFTLKSPYEQVGENGIVVTTEAYTGTRDTSYVLAVITGGASGVAVVRVTDTAGVEPTTYVDYTVTDDAEFQLGNFGPSVTVDFTGMAQAALRKGDVYKIACTAAKRSATQFNRAILDGPVVDTSLWPNPATALTNVEFRLPHSGEIASTQAADAGAWEATANGVDVDAALSLEVTTRDTGYTWVPFVDSSADLPNSKALIYVSFRAIDPVSASEGPLRIADQDDRLAYAGVNDPENEAGTLANWALSGANGLSIYLVRTGDDTEAAYNLALRKISSDPRYYAITFASQKTAMEQLVFGHCVALSADDVMLYRRTYVGVDSPGERLVAEYETDGVTPHTVTISGYGNENRLVVFGSDIDLSVLNLHEDDLLVLPSIDFRGKLLSVISDTEALLQEGEGPDAPIVAATPAQIWKADNVRNIKEYVVGKAAEFANLRATVVWCHNGTRSIDGITTIIPNRVLAAEIAGLRTSLLPQQSLTRTEVQSITGAPDMYSLFTDTDLDEIASHGVFVVTQRVEDGPVFIRHQLTTEATTPLFYEDNIQVNYDEVSLTTNLLFDPFIGKYNANSITASEMEVAWRNMLLSRTQIDFNVKLSPQLGGFENMVVRVDPVLRDTMDLSCDLLFDLPMNRVRVTYNGKVNLAAAA